MERLVAVTAVAHLELAAEKSPPRLRDYQADLCRRVSEEFAAGARRVIVQLGTGGGKTVTAAAWLSERFAAEPDTVVGWLVHTRGLRTQAAAALDLWGIESVDWSRVPPRERRWRPGRVHAFGAAMQVPPMLPNARTVLVLDECHRSAAATVAHHVEHARWRQVLGLSATPARRGWPDEITESQARFARQWDSVVCGPPLADLVAAGALADVVLRSPGAAGGDRSVLRDDRLRDSGYTAESERIFEQTLSLDAAAGFVAMLPPRPTVWFCSSLRAARRLGRLLPSSQVVVAQTGETTRDDAYRLFNSGHLSNLVTVGVLVEGVDLPAASRVVLLRPSSSRVLLSQQVGRGMRPPGDVQVLDFAGNYAALGSHPLDDLPWDETLTQVVPRRAHTSAVPPKRCPVAACDTLLGPRHGRLCPTCFAEVGRWCVACERALVGTEDGAHRRCRDCAEAERAMHRQWAQAHSAEPLLDRDALDDLARSDALEPPEPDAESLYRLTDELEACADHTRENAAKVEAVVRGLKRLQQAQAANAGAELASSA